MPRTDGQAARQGRCGDIIWTKEGNGNDAQLKITLAKTPIACLQKHIDTVKALGLQQGSARRWSFRTTTPAIRGA